MYKNILKTDHMKYTKEMEKIEHTVMDRVISEMEKFDYNRVTVEEVKIALAKPILSPRDFQALLSPAAEPFLEEMAQRSRLETRRHFGTNINLFTPLYISNYCENHCVYCGFNKYNRIRRSRLSMVEVEKEMQAIASTGLEEVLILTGESRNASGIEYIGEACKLASRYFKMVGLEIYPCNSDEYAYLNKCGADYVTVFQETYNSDKYETLHLEGNKRIFPYRFNAQERALKGGMRGVGFAALLGLDDFRKDAFATGYHAYLLQQKYPYGEFAISCPRLRPIINDDTINPKDVHERQLLQIICAYRIFLPYASITVSTREGENFRNHIISLGATKISAGVSTGIGSHSEEVDKDEGDAQFEISDTRNVQQVFDAIRERGLQPVMSSYINLTEEGRKVMDSNGDCNGQKTSRYPLRTSLG